MTKPTLDILDSINLFYTRYQNIKPIEVRLKEYTSKFFLDKQSWDEYYAELGNISFNWQEIKYSDVVNKKVSLNILPDSMGIYLFIVKANNLIFDLPKYVFYVGIAGATNKGLSSRRTLKDRLQDYFAESQIKKRDAVKIMIYKHYENIHIAYTPIASLPANKSLESIEKALIGFFGTHILANRDDIPVGLKAHAKAFNI